MLQSPTLKFIPPSLQKFVIFDSEFALCSELVPAKLHTTIYKGKHFCCCANVPYPLHPPFLSLTHSVSPHARSPWIGRRCVYRPMIVFSVMSSSGTKAYHRTRRDEYYIPLSLTHSLSLPLYQSFTHIPSLTFPLSFTHTSSHIYTNTHSVVDVIKLFLEEI